MSDFIEDIAKSYAMSNATIKIIEEVSVKPIERTINRISVYKPCLMIANKADLPNIKDTHQFLTEKFGKIPFINLIYFQLRLNVIILELKLEKDLIFLENIFYPD